MQYVGETFLFPVIAGRSIAGPSTDFQYFYPCDGATLAVNAPGSTPCDGATPVVTTPSNLALATILGADLSGSDPTFALPKLTPPAPGVEWFISNTGAFPSANSASTGDDIPFIGQISVLPTLSGRQYDPSEALACDGHLLPVAAFPAVFALLGTAFGGDGEQTFAMPNLPAPAPSLFYAMSTSGPVPQLVPYPQEVPG